MDQGQTLFSPPLIRAVLVLGIANPLIAWLILNWVTKIETPGSTCKLTVAPCIWRPPAWSGSG